MFDMKNKFCRKFFFTLVVLTTFILSVLFYNIFLKGKFDFSHLCLFCIFILLIFELNMSFWTAIIGFIILVAQQNISAKPLIQLQINTNLAVNDTKTAIIILTYNQNPEDVFQRLNTIYQSIIQYNSLHLFDFFILSDSSCPQIRENELQYLKKTCNKYNAHNKIFYNNRSINTDEKSGHIDEFCTKWGNLYDFMVILDDDSLMSAKALVEMVYRIHNNPKVAIIQTASKAYNQQTLFARILQFSENLYGQIYCAGTAFWQLSECNYFGHNAIIRVDAFKTHAKLPTLPGKRPIGGKILSHDFVEAALLREAGWEIWMAYDIVDSYEELPSNLINYAKRDRRWCQGNIQHSWFLFGKKMSMYSRFLFFEGIMAYVASPLWLFFITLSCLLLFNNADINAPSVNAFMIDKHHLLYIVIGLIVMPKLLGLALCLFNSSPTRNVYANNLMIISFLLECIFSIMVTPILMLYRNQFIFQILFQKNIGWPAQDRGKNQLSFKKACLFHGYQMIIGLILFLFLYIYIPYSVTWQLPIYLGLILSIPLSVILSRVSFGEKTLRWGLFCIPQEINPPEIIQLYKHQNKSNPINQENEVLN